MPWKVDSAMNQRMEFVLRSLGNERVTDLCREYGIARSTAYKFIDRYEKYGPKGLYDESKRPVTLARQTPVEIERLILGLKRERATWGAAKIREVLMKKHGLSIFPARSTVHEILNRNGLVKSRGKRGRHKACPTELSEVKAPNQLWCTDFKGQFRLGNKQYLLS